MFSHKCVSFSKDLSNFIPGFCGAGLKSKQKLHICFKAHVSNQTWLFKLVYYLNPFMRENCVICVYVIPEHSFLCTINGASSVNGLSCRWTVWVSAGPPRPLIYAWKGLRKSSVYLCRYTHQQHSHICADFSTSASWLHLPRVKNIPTMLEPI